MINGDCRLRSVVLAMPLLLGSLHAAGGEPAASLGETVVTATRTPETSFGTPTAVSVVAGDDIRSGPPGFNLAASLARVPGVVAQNRGSYAQDLQISMRGFGARASFGVRGIRLIVDGIPVSSPAGQGETDIFDLASAARIEVLRGPFSTLYGNAAGGVIQIFTKDGPPQPTLSASTKFGSYGTRVERLEGGGTADNLNYIIDISHFRTDGYRRHSGAERDHLHSKFRYTLGENASLTLLFNGENQPFALDPSGLNREQIRENPRQAVDRVDQFDAGETHRHRQGGIVYEQQLDNNDRLHATGWLGSRRVLQFLPFSGDDPLSGGAVVDLDNNFGGGDAHWVHDGALFGYPLTVIGGFDYERLHERRRGFVNDDGSLGDLRRNEDDISSQSGQYVQARWRLGGWQLSAGARHTRVTFDSDDHFVTALDPDDSGSRSFTSTDPVAGVLYEITPHLNWYANYGRGFETPGFSELAYRPDGTAGFNFDLKPSTSKNYETGIKGDWNALRLRLAVFRIDTDDEIIVGSSINGRTSFRNAGSTRRRGIELSLDGDLGSGFEGYFAYSRLHVQFDGGPLDGNRLPGVPRNTLYGELRWQYRPLGFYTTLDAQWRDRVYVDEQNTDFAASYVVSNYEAGFEQNKDAWRLTEYARVNNLFDRGYIGAVIVNASNDRYFEPAPTRNYAVGVSASYKFR